jgi:uncharacterized membrane protein YoaK (UPF0700 family)
VILISASSFGVDGHGYDALFRSIAGSKPGADDRAASVPRTPEAKPVPVGFGDRVPGSAVMQRRLMALLYLATVVAGVVDAVSFLTLGRVFVANMTGNVVFVGFGLAGAAGISVARSLAALAAFLLGSAAGGAMARALERHRRRWLIVAFGAETTCFALALGLEASGAVAASGNDRLALIAPMAFGMGLQNATASALDLPDLTTTVLTRTLTGIASQLFAEPDWPRLARRLLAVGAMFAGAALGAVLALRVDLTAGLALAVALLACVCAGASLVEHGPLRPGG